MQSEMLEAIVIGGGQAGLAAGYHLQKAGVGFRILEASTQASGSWPLYYDSLRLFSPAGYSSLPGLPFPGDPARYPTRDEVIAYLSHYAAHFQLPVQTQTRVEAVERQAEGFSIKTATHTYFARNVIAATGSFSRPYVPTFPGQAEFPGHIQHAVTYRNPAPFRGQRVVVVGAGNSAVQIAAELAQVARVTLATREPLQFRPQRILGQDLHFWLRWTGLDAKSHFASRPVPPIDTSGYAAMLKRGLFDQRPMFTQLTAHGVEWAEGQEEAVDALVLATGYRPNLSYLAGLGALDEAELPLQTQGVSRTVPGLYFVGLSYQRNLASATLRGVGPDAARVVQHLRQRHTSPVSRANPLKAWYCRHFCHTAPAL